MTPKYYIITPSQDLFMRWIDAHNISPGDAVRVTEIKRVVGYAGDIRVLRTWNGVSQYYDLWYIDMMHKIEEFTRCRLLDIDFHDDPRSPLLGELF